MWTLTSVQVAAAAHKTAIPQVKTPGNTVDSNQSKNITSDNDNASPTKDAANGAETLPASQTAATHGGQVPGNLNRLMKETSINDRSAPSSSVENLGRRDNSDTKSITSRTTLTLDEKESLMPDDSASMQGARDEEAVSPAELSKPVFKDDGDPDARAFRDQLFEIDRHGGKRVQLAPRPVVSNPVQPQQNGGIDYPSTGRSPQAPEVVLTRDISNGPPADMVLPPDDKLVEALNSPKDRLFVLKIEQDFIDFIKNSKDLELQLPSTNTFYRLLSHKLAEYYLLGHIYEDSLKAVRIRKLPHTRLAPPLIGCEPKSEGTTPPPTGSMQIMRRGQGGPHPPSFDSRPQSSSEYEGMGGGDDDKDGQKRPRDKSGLTREEREKQYNEARARIFEGFNEKQADSAENSANQSKEMSRSSSHSGPKKNKRGKRPKDDSFEARSSYTSVDGQAFVNNNSFMQPQHNNGLFTNPSAYPQYTGMSPMQFQPHPAGFQMPQQEFSATGAWTGQQQYGQPYPMQPNMASYPQFAPQHYDQTAGYYGSPPMASQSTPKAQHPGLATYFPTFQQPTDQNGWAQPGYQTAYNQHNGFGREGNQNVYMMPYGYDPNMQQVHGYNTFHGQQFNPQSQAFVPNASMGSMQSWPQQPQTPSNFSSPHFQQASPARNGQNSNNRNKGSNKNGQAQQQQNGSIAKWANSSSLPAKPPPTSSSLSFQMPKHLEQGQPLPSKPLNANGST